MISIYKPGSEIRLWGNVKALIVAAMVDSKGVSYKVAWWNGSDLKQEWVNDVLIESGSEVVPLGFVPKGT